MKRLPIHSAIPNFILTAELDVTPLLKSTSGGPLGLKNALFLNGFEGMYTKLLHFFT